MTSVERPEVAFGSDGLVPAIIQDVADGRVLMLAWMDPEALDATLATGEVHFHSRSRDRLWRKGETSGNVLRLVELVPDCDRDAVLVTVEPTGPTCHRGTRSCFDLDGAPAGARVLARASVLAGAGARAEVGQASSQGFAWLETLWSTIAERNATRPEGSYTARLLAGGVDAVGRKVTEEATEMLLAAKDDAAAEARGNASAGAGAADRGGAGGANAGGRVETRAALAGEAADLLYHALVLLAERDVSPSSVLEVLRERHAR